jgi:hypothetical protein
LVPVVRSIDLAALVIAVGAFGAMFRLKVSMLWTLGGAAMVGLVYYLVFVG